jgi:hypothetical protein
MSLDFIFSLNFVIRAGCCFSMIPFLNCYWGCQAAVKTLEAKPGNPKPDETMEFLKVEQNFSK